MLANSINESFGQIGPASKPKFNICVPGTRVQKTWQSRCPQKSAALASRWVPWINYDASKWNQLQSIWNWPYSGGGEGWDGIFASRGRPVRLQAGPQPHVRVHGQLHQEAQEPAGEVHDEQRVGELHNSAGRFAHSRNLCQTLLDTFLPRLSPTRRHKKRCYALPTFLRCKKIPFYVDSKWNESAFYFAVGRCLHQSTERNTTSTDWWRTEVGSPPPGCQGGARATQAFGIKKFFSAKKMDIHVNSWHGTVGDNPLISEPLEISRHTLTPKKPHSDTSSSVICL